MRKNSPYNFTEKKEEAPLRGRGCVDGQAGLSNKFNQRETKVKKIGAKRELQLVLGR